MRLVSEQEVVPSATSFSRCEHVRDTNPPSIRLSQKWARGRSQWFNAAIRLAHRCQSHPSQVHYDNPSLEAGVVDNIGFEAFYVENTLRPYDAASIIVGDPIVKFGDVRLTLLLATCQPIKAHHNWAFRFRRSRMA